MQARFKRKGSLTVFFSLIMVSVMSLMFTMAELVRVYALSSVSLTVTEGAAESGFSEYCRPLWDDYKILGIDYGFGTETMGPVVLQDKILDIAQTNVDVEGMTFERLSANGATVKNYAYLTDDYGKGVIYEGVKAAKEGLATSVVDNLRADVNTIDLTETDLDSQVNAGKESLEKPKTESDEKERYEQGQLEDNPLDAYDAMKEAIAGGVLKTLNVSDEKISKKSVDLTDVPSKRNLKKGTAKENETISATDRILFGQYLIDNYSFFGESKNHKGMDYEIEYIIAGKDSDKENLAAISERLLAIREGINALAIATNPSLMGKVTEVSTILTGGNPALMTVVEPALIAAWAYAESVLEVRSLLSGGKIAYVKSASNWNSDLLHLSGVINSGSKAANVKNGISYEAYLRCFIATENIKKLGLRSCDVLENELHTKEDYRLLKLDSTIYKGDVEISYQGSEMFLSVFRIPGKTIDGYKYTKTVSMKY